VGLTSKEREGRGKRKGTGRKGGAKRKNRKGMDKKGEGRGREKRPPVEISGYATEWG